MLYMNTNLNNLITNVYSDEISTTIKSLCAVDTELYLVGGYVRDLAINKLSCDRDYIVKGESAIELAKKVAEKVQGFFVLLDETFDIARVVMPDRVNYLDFAGCFGNTIYDDINRRDFTINSIAIKIDDGKESGLFDPNNGLNDLEKGIIRTVSEKNLEDDPLRCLRAYRFSSQLGFKIHPETIQYIDKYKKLLSNVAVERVQVELIKLFEGKYCSENLEKMKENGLLFQIFPELEKEIKVPPNLHHHLGLLDHSIETVRQIEILENTMPAWFIEKLNSDQANGIKYISLLKIAGLLHDLGKPETWQIDEEGRHRFIKHDEIGAQKAVDLLNRLKFSKNACKYITKLIKYHIYPSQLIREDEPATEKAIFRMFRKLESETPDVILIAMADRLSARGPEITEDIVRKNLNGLQQFLDIYSKSKEKVESLPKLLSGNDVMEILEIPVGPRVGAILKTLKEAQISGDINTREEAIAFIKGLEFKNNK